MPLKIFVYAEKHSVCEAAEKAVGEDMKIVGCGDFRSGPLQLPDILPSYMASKDAGPQSVEEINDIRVALWRDAVKDNPACIERIARAAQDAGAQMMVLLVDPWTRPLAEDIKKGSSVPVGIASPSDLSLEALAVSLRAAASAGMNQPQHWKLTFDDGGPDDPALRTSAGVLVADVYSLESGRRIVASLNRLAHLTLEQLEDPLFKVMT